MWLASRRLFYPPEAAFGLGEEAGVAEDLKLLADFIAALLKMVFWTEVRKEIKLQRYDRRAGQKEQAEATPCKTFYSSRKGHGIVKG
jgi:hypothetical protein